MKENHKAMAAYVKNMSKRNELEDRDKIMPVAYLGSAMSSHGDDFDINSEFGQCLSGTQDAPQYTDYALFLTIRH
jgi:hypothetical protein